MLRRGFLDTRPLRSSPAFRRVWVTGLASVIGAQVMFVAVLQQVWEMTSSPVWTGAIGLVRALPLVVFGVLGGAIADAIDRRTLVRATMSLQVLVGLGLATHALTGSQSLLVLFALVAAGAGIGAVDAPARRTFIPRLLERDQVSAGIALQHLGFQATMLGGPALGGVILSQWDAAVCYLIYAGAVLVAMYGVIRLPAMPVQVEGQRRTFTAIAEGVRFVTTRPVLRGSFASDLAATLLSMPISLFPLINEVRFGGDPQTLGLFLSCVAAGGMLAGLTSGWVTRADRPGLVQLGAGAVWGIALAAFGLAGPLWLALGMLVVAGAADTISVVSRGGMVQLVTPDSHRGRVNALEHTVGVAGPELGNARAGLVAGMTSAAGALVSGGLACVVVIGWITLRNRELRAFRVSVDARKVPNAQAPPSQDPAGWGVDERAPAEQDLGARRLGERVPAEQDPARPAEQDPAKPDEQ